MHCSNAFLLFEKLFYSLLSYTTNVIIDINQPIKNRKIDHVYHVKGWPKNPIDSKIPQL